MHKKMLTFVGLMAFVLLFATSCGGSKSTRVEGVQLPAFVLNPFMDGQFGAYGIARPSLGGVNEQFKKARQEGRVELGRTVSTKIQAAYTKFFTEGGEASIDEAGKITRNELAQEMSEDISRQLTNQILQGTRQMKIWIHPKTKDAYIWMVIDPTMKDILADQIKAAARKQVAAKSQIKAELKAKDALSRLDAAIDAEMKRQQ